jgi:hypothetical protein
MHCLRDGVWLSGLMLRSRKASQARAYRWQQWSRVAEPAGLGLTILHTVLAALDSSANDEADDGRFRREKFRSAAADVWTDRGQQVR